MRTIASELQARVSQTKPQLLSLTEENVSIAPGPGRWSKKEILGHLIDSASNNHQRFVRAQLADELTFPGYEQEGWARCQQHAVADWNLLVELWSNYNLHLAKILAHVSQEKYTVVCRIGSNNPMTLLELARDYLRHLDHHLAQLAR